MSAELNLKALPTEAYAVARVAHTVAKSLIALRPALSLCSTLVSLLLPLVRRCHPLWRFTARWYVAGFDRLAAWHALQACRSARQQVPAYRQFLSASTRVRPRERLVDFPETTKDNYAGRYTLAQQCRGGRWSARGACIDESSGSTGRPFNWLRSGAELEDIHRSIAHYIRLEFPTRDLICINAFSMGAWATGLNFTMAMRRIATVKSIGPDVANIIATLKLFGPGFNYLITAYPPFLKHLCDELTNAGVPPREYRLYALVAGEGMTEALRDYLERRFIKVRSGYGASDVQIGVGGETAFSVALRRLIAARPALRHALLGPGEERVPMIFQYNPLESFIEVNGNSELVFTLGSASMCCPKLRYNLHDEGRVLPYPEVLRIVKRVTGLEPSKLGDLPDAAMRLPVLFLFGRRDSTISVMGANIYPQDIEHGLLRDPELARGIANFSLALGEDADLSLRVTVHVELRATEPLSPPAAHDMSQVLERAIHAHLIASNRDFANACSELPSATRIGVILHGAGAGPFADRTNGIKNRYLLRRRAAAAQATCTEPHSGASGHG